MPPEHWVLQPAKGPSPVSTKEMFPTLDEAFAEAQDHGIDAHLLVGNGLSIQARLPFFTPVINQYALNYPLGARASELLRNIPALAPEDSLAYIRKFPTAHPKTGKPSSEYSLLRDALVHAIIDAHPDTIESVSPWTRQSIANFFSRFDTIYSLNYDLLPSWTIADSGPDSKFSDGFVVREDPDGVDPRQEIYRGVDGNSIPNIWYLHGSLNLYREGSQLVRVSGDPTQESLRDIFKRRSDLGLLPLIVLEGTMGHKRRAIKRDAYLREAMQSLRNISGILFTFGVGFNWQDRDILNAVLKNPNPIDLLIGLYGDYFTPENLALQYRVEQQRLQAYYQGFGHDHIVTYFRSDTVFG